MKNKTVTALAALLAACGAPEPPGFQGYAEGEFVLVAASLGGRLERLSVARGQQVAAQAPLFALDQAQEEAQVREAQARLEAARARVANLQGGRRPAEREAAAAEVAAAQASQRLAASQLAQQERLFRGGFIAQARLDEARAAARRDAARLAEARAAQRLAGQSLGREAELAAARAEADAAQAALAQARWRLEQKSPVAPGGALVHDTYFSPGEWVAAGVPVVSLLPPANVKLRFFVPETMLASVAPGRAVSASCDGCPGPIPATVSYVSPQAEYTPPVLYGREQRAKLVFLVEARPAAEHAARLKPGQPVDVVLQ